MCTGKVHVHVEADGKLEDDDDEGSYAVSPLQSRTMYIAHPPKNSPITVHVRYSSGHMKSHHDPRHA